MTIADEIAVNGLLCVAALAFAAHKGYRTPLFLFCIVFSLFWAVYNMTWLPYSPFDAAIDLGVKVPVENLASTVWQFTDGIQMLVLLVIAFVVMRSDKPRSAWWAFPLFGLFGSQEIAHDMWRQKAYTSWEEYTQFLDNTFYMQAAVLIVAGILGVFDGIRNGPNVRRASRFRLAPVPRI